MAFLGGFFGFKTWGSAFLMAPIFAVSFTTHAQAQLGVTIKEDSFLTENARLPVPCQESLQTFKTGSAMDLQPLAAAALSCAPLFGHCRARPELKDPVGYLGDFNETLVRQVVGVHMDLLYRKGIYAAGNKPDGSPTHPSQVWADPKGLDSPVCNIACGEINDARGVRKDQAFAKTCGLWGWENKQWYYVGGQKLNPWQCRGIHDHIWDMITFSDANSQPVSRAINQNLDRTMGRSIDTSGTGPWSGADDDCEGAFIEDFAVSTRFAAYQTGVLVQATWFALDEVLDEANSDQHSFRVSPECAGLAADAVNDLRIGLGALEELKLCGPTKKLQDGSVVVNDLAHVGADPNHPERDADRPPTQLDAQIRALVVATQASHLTRAAECEVYARAHKRFQERTLTPEAMIADAERIHWSLFEPNFFASETLELDDTDDAMILDVMWGFGKTLLPALGLN